MGQVLPIVGAYSPQLTHLRVCNLHNLSTLAPFLARFTHLTDLYLEECNPDAPNLPQWPAPTFHLTTLSIYLHCPDQRWPVIDAADFAWLTTSSRASLQYLNLSSGTDGVLRDVLTWGGGLRSVAWFVSHKRVPGRTMAVGGAEAVEVLELARLRGMGKLRVSVELRGLDVGDEDSIEIHEAVEREAKRVNRQLGREVVSVDWW